MEKVITIKDNVKMVDENDVAELLKQSASITKPKSTPELTPLQRLTIPVPEQYLETYTEDGKEFNGYKAQYAINLLNEVYGLGNWFAEFKLEKIENINRAWLSYGIVKIYIGSAKTLVADGIGGSYAKRIENSLKGTKTSAFKNACRYLGIGNELYLAGHDEDIVYEKIDETVTPSEPVANVPNEIKSTLDLISTSKSVEQLEGVLPLISKTEGKAVRDLLIKMYNNKKINLAEKK